MKKILLTIFFLVGMTSTALATHYLTGDVTLNGSAYTGSTAYVSMWCNGSNWNSCSEWASTNSNGSYTFDGANNSYGCCSATYSGRTWDRCQIYAYQYDNTSVANSVYSDLTFDCSTTTVKNIALRPKDKTINVTVTASGQAVTGVSVSCYESGGSSYTSSWVDNCTNGVCDVPTIAGTHTCNAYCRWSTWGSDCPYGGYPTKTITISADETSETMSLDLTLKNKKIRACVYAGDDLVTDDITVSCYSQGGGMDSIGGSVSEAESDGCYLISAVAGTFYCSSYCNIWPCDQYKGNPSAYVTVGESDSTKDVTMRYEIPDKKIRVTLKAGGSKITSGMTVYAYKQGGDWSSSSVSYPNSDGYYEMTVSTGTFSVYAYPTNYQNSEVSGNPQGKVVFSDSDPSGTVADVQLTFLKNDATIAGTVSDGSAIIPDVWVNINAHDVGTGGSGLASLVVKNYEVTNGAASSTQVYASASTNSSGAFSAKVPAGTYSVCVWPPWNRQDLAQICEEVTAAASGLSTVNLVMEKKTATINGCVTDSSGQGIKAYVNCWSYVGSTNSSDYMWKETDSSGCFSGSVVDGRTYSCTASPNTWNDPSSAFCSYTNEGQQSVTATATAQTVNFTVPSCNCSLTVNVVNAQDETIPINGSLECKPKTFRSGEYYYGSWGQLTAGVGTVDTEPDRELCCKSWFWDSSYTGGDEVCGTCSGGSGSISIGAASVINDAICGSYVDGEGNPVQVTDISYISVYATKGNNYKYCEATPSGYCCDVSEGTWQLGYWIDPGSGFSSGSAGTTTNSVAVSASGGVTYDLTLLNTCSVAVSVLDLDSSGRPNVWVECCPYSASQEGANSYQYGYSCGWGESSSDGQVTVNVGCPAGSEGITYYCNAYMPYSMRDDEGLNNPQECSSQAIMGQVNTCFLQYEQPDGQLNVVVSNGDVTALNVSGLALASGTVETAHPLKGIINALETDASNPYAFATIDCFSPAGGAFQAVTDENGNATCSCTSDDKWFVVAYNIVGTALYVSEATECACSADGTSCAVAVDFATTVPDAQSVTIDDAATDQMSITLSDGAEFSCAPGCLADSGDMVTCSVAPAVTPFTPNKVPVNFYGYFISCYETVVDPYGSSTRNSIQQLKADATIKMPCNAAQLENMGLTDNDIQCSYWDTATGSYKTNTDCAIDCNEGISLSVNHLTDFVIVGNGYLGGIQGEDGGEVGKEEATEGSGVNQASGGCGGCYMMSSRDDKLDDRILWGLILTLIGLSRIQRLRTAPHKKKQ